MNQAKKLHELTINVSSQSRTNLITNTTFFTMDVQTGKKIINFTLENEPLDLTNATVMLAFDFVAEQKSKIMDSKDGSVIIEDAESGVCSVVLPNHLYQYSGDVLVHVYVMFEDGRSLDCGVIVTKFEESWLDQELDEMTDFYVQRFEDLADEIRERANEIKVEVEAKFEEVHENIENTKSKIKQLKLEIKDFSLSIKNDTKNALIEIQNQVKEKIIEAETEFLNLNEEIKSKLREKLEELNSVAELKEAIKELMKEMKGQFETDVEAILQTTTEIREQIESDKVSILDFHEHLADDEIHVTIEDRERWDSARPSEFSIQSPDGSVTELATIKQDEIERRAKDGELEVGQSFFIEDSKADVLGGFVGHEEFEEHVGDEGSHVTVLPQNHFTANIPGSTYPHGKSAMDIISAPNNNGFPGAGLVETIHLSPIRCLQHHYAPHTNSPMLTQTRNWRTDRTGNNGWSGWELNIGGESLNVGSMAGTFRAGDLLVQTGGLTIPTPGIGIVTSGRIVFNRAFAHTPNVHVLSATPNGHTTVPHVAAWPNTTGFAVDSRRPGGIGTVNVYVRWMAIGQAL